MREITASHVEVVTEARFEVAESPVWDVQRRSLVWVDIPRGTVHWFDKDAEIGTLELGQAVGAVGLRRRGGFVVAARDGFGIVDRSTELEIVAPVEADQIATRMNDGSCDSAGRFWAGTMAYDTRPGLGAVYRLGPDHAVTKVLDGVSVSNGICWDDKAGRTDVLCRQRHRPAQHVRLRARKRQRFASTSSSGREFFGGPTRWYCPGRRGLHLDGDLGRVVGSSLPSRRNPRTP